MRSVYPIDDALLRNALLGGEHLGSDIETLDALWQKFSSQVQEARSSKIDLGLLDMVDDFIQLLKSVYPKVDKLLKALGREEAL